MVILLDLWIRLLPRTINTWSCPYWQGEYTNVVIKLLVTCNIVKISDLKLFMMKVVISLAYWAIVGINSHMLVELAPTDRKLFTHVFHSKLHIYCFKLPSQLTAWLFYSFHTKSDNMKALVILSHSWSPFLLLTCLYGKNELLRVSARPSGVFSWDKRKCEHNLFQLVFVYILLSTSQWVHMALAIKRPDNLLM